MRLGKGRDGLLGSDSACQGALEMGHSWAPRGQDQWAVRPLGFFVLYAVKGYSCPKKDLITGQLRGGHFSVLGMSQMIRVSLFT